MSGKEPAPDAAPRDDPDPPDALAPFVPADPLMAIFWFPALKYALGRDDIMKAFERDTGLVWRPARSPLERMIDGASGHTGEAFLARFAGWFNENIWGDPDLHAGEGDETL